MGRLICRLRRLAAAMPSPLDGAPYNPSKRARQIGPIHDENNECSAPVDGLATRETGTQAGDGLATRETSTQTCRQRVRYAGNGIATVLRWQKALWKKTLKEQKAEEKRKLQEQKDEEKKNKQERKQQRPPRTKGVAPRTKGVAPNVSTTQATGAGSSSSSSNAMPANIQQAQQQAQQRETPEQRPISKKWKVGMLKHVRVDM